ncbi:MAG TPA: cyclophane-forming radical SAM/SPASM peptide maturase GrrM/OscB [Rhodoplanes sp.]|nr:cyclophane-forming radical SAM/SPASM peptide maturase GrrM/OscB [Rhodoplanes sp.]
MATPHGTGVDPATPRLRLLVLQPTPFCNIDCSYCYLPDRAVRARMSLATLDLVCKRVFGGACLDRKLEVAWHGGEPLTVPLPWYEDALALMAERRPATVQLEHLFQTNGLLLNANWARFFARTEAKVGLSVDGPAEFHDARRRTRRGDGTFDGAMRAVRLLQDQGLPFHVITVLTEHALDHPDRLFDFYVANGITEVGFNIEEIEGVNTTSSFTESGVETKFREFISRFFQRAWAAPGLLKVRELESAIALLLSDEPARDEQNLPFAIISVGHDGMLSTFSPELLGMRHSRFRGFTFGHVATHSLADLAHDGLYRAINKEIRRGVEACQRDCRYFRWCGGGAPANKLFETGRFDATQTMHCRLTRQAMLDETIAQLEAQMERPEPNRAVVGSSGGSWPQQECPPWSSSSPTSS